jgi:thioredoxin reductase (NADPH)
MERSVIVISGDSKDSGLYKAKRIDNYPGMPGVSGEAMLTAMYAQLSASGAELVRGIALSAVKTKKGFMVSVGNDAYQSRTLIVAVGAAKGVVYENEDKLLGRGVSYCAVCDGALYKNKPVVVLALRSDAEEEAEQLRRIGCDVTVIDPKGKKIAFIGDDKLTAVKVDGEELAAACVFVLRAAIAPAALISGLEISDGAIIADRLGRTSIEGLFAAGDCGGKPYQVAKAVGEGQIAAYSANDLI